MSRLIELGPLELEEIRKAKAAWERLLQVSGVGTSNVTWRSLLTDKPTEMDMERAEYEWASLSKSVTLSLLVRLCMIELGEPSPPR
tara:strand:+ start:3877 stop:4134 length:258 start_codon:yes stop_codon:yes gene_type:complete